MYNISMRLSGKEISEKLYGELKKRVSKLQKKNVIPHLVVICVGGNLASVAYVRQKQKNGEELGAKVTVLNYKTDLTTEVLEKKVKLLNIDPFVHVILIQRPLHEQVADKKLELISDPQKDI